MPTQLPAQVNPFQLARAAGRLEGALGLAGLQRLGAQCCQCPAGEAWVELGFSPGGRRRVLIDGLVEAQVPVECQRCLESMLLSLRADVSLCATRDPDAEPPEGYELLELGDAAIDVAALVEDELLLALPVAPVHAPGACEPPGGAVGADAAAAPEPDATASPFAALRGLVDREGGH